MLDIKEIRMNNIKIFILFIGVIFLNSCSSILEPQEYLKWVESDENGMFGVKKIENLEYKIHYKPHDYIALKSVLKNDLTDFDKKKKQLGDLQYFTFQLKMLKGNDSPLKYQLTHENEYYDRIAYLSFGIQDDIILIENGDTLNCVLAVFERNYNIAPTSTINLAFEPNTNNKKNSTKEFVFNDRMFNNGPIRIKINKKKIQNIPELKI